MASEVSICNLALSHIGQDSEIQAIAPPDGSAEADYCAQFYPICRDLLLEEHAWRFATRRQALAELVTTEIPTAWTYAYQVPSLIRPISVLSPEATDDSDTQDYIIETLADGTPVLYTNVEDATLRYVRQVTDVNKFTPGFANALSWLVASYIAGPITRDLKLKKDCYSQYMIEAGKAKFADSMGRQADQYGRATPAGIQARA